MFSGGKFLQNVSQNVCRDKGKKIGMALTISDNLWQPFVWGWVQFRSAQQSHWREPVFLPSSNIFHCFKNSFGTKITFFHFKHIWLKHFVWTKPQKTLFWHKFWISSVMGGGGDTFLAEKFRDSGFWSLSLRQQYIWFKHLYNSLLECLFVK